MKIIVDAFGGDNAPLEIIKGAAEAKAELGADIILTGDEEIIRKVSADNGISLDGIEIVHAPDVFTNNDQPTSIRTKAKADTSLAVGFRLLKEGAGDAFLSAGNSGAIGAGSMFIVKRIKGVQRVAFAPVIPNMTGKFMLIDSGINTDVRPKVLQQFALMGSVYMNKVMGVENPRVGLANVGTEEHKGDELRQQTYKLLQNTPVNFVGNVEGRDIPMDGADVVVCDGFTGNLIIKTYEGVALALLGKIKGIFTKSLKNKLAAALVLGDMKQMKKEFDLDEFGGTAVLGCSKPVFKAHGNAKAKTIKNAIRVCMDYVSSDIITTVSEALKDIADTEDEAE
ncbi:MAG: phosphate acyltransferase PlsX [Ruminococcus sp.]|jgi:glycerol-3-phosphate acyltransferase PlsX|nr:phosphate acyltransferase PlsX [Ruminococcus sp.]MBQ9472515.1 phosphate acyltransferase PlsX [Ruminococcus sp.]